MTQLLAVSQQEDCEGYWVAPAIRFSPSSLGWATHFFASFGDGEKNQDSPRVVKALATPTVFAAFKQYASG